MTSPSLLPISHVVPKRLSDLAAATGLTVPQIRYFAHQAQRASCYRVMSVPKKTGGHRFIHAPVKNLKFVQRAIAALLTRLYRPNARATGYIQGSSILRNALFHSRNRLILNIDLLDYFDQVTAPRLFGMLTSPPYNLSKSVAAAIVNICTLNGAVPQGAPTSPILANMLTSHLDRLLVDLCRNFGCSYSRYSDDITISTNRRRFPRNIISHTDEPLIDAFNFLGSDLLSAFQRVGFSINPRKVRLLHKHDRQEVTGVTVNEFPNARRNLIRQTRKMLHILEKFGEDEARNEYNRLHPFRPVRSYTESVRGRIEHLKFVRGSGDRIVAKMVDKFNALQTGCIDYTGPEDWNSTITKPVVCLINEIDSRQGTAFHIGGGVFITNHHVAYFEGLPDRNLKFVIDGCLFRLDVEVLRSFPDLEIAFIRCPDPLLSAFLPSEAVRVDASAEIDTGAEVTVVGFPNWQRGDSHHVEKGAVTARTQKDGIPALRLSAKIFFGNSGGPVYDKRGRAIGVAFAGASVMTDEDFSYLCVPPDSLRRAFERSVHTVGTS